MLTEVFQHSSTKLVVLLESPTFISFRIPILIFLALAGIYWTWWLYRFVITPWMRPDDVPEIPYYIPFVGHALSFFVNADLAFTRGREYFRNTREPFALTVGGETLYILTSPVDVAEASKVDSAFTFDVYMEDMMHCFGASPDAIQKIWAAPTASREKSGNYLPNTTRLSLAKLCETAVKDQLGPGSKLEPLLEKLLSSISRLSTWDTMSHEAIIGSSHAGRNVSLREWTQTILLEGATEAFFGKALLRVKPDILKNFSQFDDLSWKLNYKVPPPFSNDMHALRREAQDGLVRYFDLPASERTDACQLITLLEGEMRSIGTSTKDIAAYITMFYWALNANTWKVVFWALSYLAHDTALLQALQDEFTLTDSSTTSMNDYASQLKKFPKFTAFYHECIRMCASSISMRHIVRKTQLRGKVLYPGNRVVIPFRQMLMDDQVFGSDVDYFDAERFLKDESLLKSKSFKPFGLGNTYCPGRFMAQAEIQVCIARIIQRFEFELADTTQAFPTYDTKKPTLGIMGPTPDSDCIVRVKPRIVSHLDQEKPV